MSKRYLEMLFIFSDAFQNKEKLIIEWSNGLKVRCDSLTGVYETDTEPEEEDYIGEYAAAVENGEILQLGKDDSIPIWPENNSIEINIFTIPDKIESEDGTLLWQRKYPIEEYTKQEP